MPDTQFELELDRFAAEFAAEAEAFGPQIAEQLLLDIFQNSPYWSGRSMASWRFSLGEALVEEATDVPKKPGGISAEEAQERSLASVANLASFALGETIFLTQATAYLGLIEAGTHGSSAGFVAAALVRYIGLIGVDVSL